MLKTILKILKKLFISVFLIYGYNLLAVPTGIIIPINIMTVFFVYLFDIPALLSLITIIFFVF